MHVTVTNQMLYLYLTGHKEAYLTVTLKGSCDVVTLSKKEASQLQPDRFFYRNGFFFVKCPGFDEAKIEVLTEGFACKTADGFFVERATQKRLGHPFEVIYAWIEGGGAKPMRVQLQFMLNSAWWAHVLCNTCQLKNKPVTKVVG